PGPRCAIGSGFAHEHVMPVLGFVPGSGACSRATSLPGGRQHSRVSVTPQGQIFRGVAIRRRREEPRNTRNTRKRGKRRGASLTTEDAGEASTGIRISRLIDYFRLFLEFRRCFADRSPFVYFVVHSLIPFSSVVGYRLGGIASASFLGDASEYWSGLHGGRHHQGRRASHCLTRASRAEETMARPKRWYDPEASQALRVVTRSENELSYAALRWRHPRVMPGIGECLLYPLSDGPGLRLLVLFPPAFWVLSLPIFDFIAFLQPLTKSDWALGLAILPIFLPLMFSFAMTLGYVLLFLGYVLVASAMGENDHPRWPEWHPAEISEGIIR